MMRLWVSRNSEVPLREQLTTQLLLGVLSNDVKPGQKLPSTRELAHRLRIHSNTVSAAYRDLVRRGWLEYRKGSGIYVPERRAKPSIDPGLELDQRIAALIQEARQEGFTLREIQSRLKRWFDVQPPDHFLLLESEIELQNILVEEIRDGTGFPVRGAAPEECADTGLLAGAVPVFLFNKAEQIQRQLPAGMDCILLHSRSVPVALAQRNPIPPDALLAVASRWPEFLKWARAILVAAGVHPDALNFCDAAKPGWQRGFHQSTAVIADTLTAKSIPRGPRVIVFPLIADTSLAELRRYIEFHPMAASSAKKG